MYVIYRCLSRWRWLCPCGDSRCHQWLQKVDLFSLGSVLRGGCSELLIEINYVLFQLLDLIFLSLSRARWECDSNGRSRWHRKKPPITVHKHTIWRRDANSITRQSRWICRVQRQSQQNTTADFEFCLSALAWFFSGFATFDFADSRLLAI